MNIVCPKLKETIGIALCYSNPLPEIASNT